MTKQSTTRLVIEAKNGDSEALGRLLEQYRGFLLMRAHRFLDERLRRRLDPSDIVQHTFLEAKRDLDKFRGRSPAEFGAWLKQILRNNLATAVTQHVVTRKRSIQNEATSPNSVQNDSQAGQWIASLPGDESTPSGQVMRAEAALELMECLHQLPESQAEAIRLRYMEGQSLAEIVERMGRSETAVAGLLKRGLKKLRSLMIHPE